jgi:hypothetical protein
MIKAPSSYIESNAAFRCLVKANDKRVFFIEDLSRNHLFLDRFEFNDYIFVQFGWHSHEWRYKYELEYISQHKNIDVSKIIVMGATKDECAAAKKIGFDSVYVNHNCWLDENLFKLSEVPYEQRLYDLVLVTRPERWKRPFLANLIDRLAIVKGHNFRKNDYFDLATLNPKYLNESRINPNEVHAVISNSLCGGIFSEEEGACYSSSEYLLSGLPVVSTNSHGGRDIWYTQFNSVIVEPDETSVRGGVNLLIENLLSGSFDPKKIRSDHIELSAFFRNNFESKLREILGAEQDKFLPSSGLGSVFKHKMIDYVHAINVDTVFQR